MPISQLLLFFVDICDALIDILHDSFDGTMVIMIHYAPQLQLFLSKRFRFCR